MKSGPLPKGDVEKLLIMFDRKVCLQKIHGIHKKSKWKVWKKEKYGPRKTIQKTKHLKLSKDKITGMCRLCVASCWWKPYSQCTGQEHWKKAVKRKTSSTVARDSDQSHQGCKWSGQKDNGRNSKKLRQLKRLGRSV